MTLKAAPDWGDDGEDVSLRSEEYLEFTTHVSTTPTIRTIESRPMDIVG